MEELHNAVAECAVRFDEQDYDYERAIAYANPNTVNTALENSTQWVRPSEKLTLLGIPVERCASVPEDVVVVVHFNAARMGPSGIQFAQLDD